MGAIWRNKRIVWNALAWTLGTFFEFSLGSLFLLTPLPLVLRGCVGLSPLVSAVFTWYYNPITFSIYPLPLIPNNNIIVFNEAASPIPSPLSPSRGLSHLHWLLRQQLPRLPRHLLYPDILRHSMHCMCHIHLPPRSGSDHRWLHPQQPNNRNSNIYLDSESRSPSSNLLWWVLQFISRPLHLRVVGSEWEVCGGRVLIQDIQHPYQPLYGCVEVQLNFHGKFLVNSRHDDCRSGQQCHQF